MNSRLLNKVLIAANLALILTVILLVSRTGKPPGTLSSVERTEAPRKEEAPAASPPKPRPYAEAMADSDWKGWVNTLREAGVPGRVLAELVRESFNQQWQTRQAETQAAYMRGDIDSDGLAVANLEHDLEQEKQMRSALGEEEFRRWDLQNVMGSLNLSGVQLTEAETNSVYALEKSLLQRMNELQMARLKGELTQAAYEEQQAKAQADHDQQMKSLLGDQRYAAMQGTDTGAGDLRRNLAHSGIDSGEVPFEQLLVSQSQYLQHRKEMEYQINEARSQISNYEQEIQRSEEAREQQLQQMLGTNVFDAFEQGQDPRYKEMKRFEKDWGLDDSAVDYVYRTIKYYEKAAEDYQRRARAVEAQGQVVDWDAVHNNLKVFARQTEQTLQGYLGDDRFDALKRNRVFPFTSEP